MGLLVNVLPGCLPTQFGPRGRVCGPQTSDLHGKLAGIHLHDPGSQALVREGRKTTEALGVMAGIWVLV